MKLNIKNLKGEVFQIEVEPTDNVNFQLDRFPILKSKYKMLKTFKLIC
jgi:hypothetical protein